MNNHLSEKNWGLLLFLTTIAMGVYLVVEGLIS